jgi:hypothetical protein
MGIHIETGDEILAFEKQKQKTLDDSFSNGGRFILIPDESFHRFLGTTRKKSTEIQYNTVSIVSIPTSSWRLL